MWNQIFILFMALVFSGIISWKFYLLGFKSGFNHCWFQCREFRDLEKARKDADRKPPVIEQYKRIIKILGIKK